MKRAAVISGLLLALCFSAVAGEKNNEEQFGEILFTVLREASGKPVRNASVILHPLDEEGNTKKGYQVKTDNQGRIRLDVVPYGKVRIQVIARGLQTYGEDFTISQPTQEIVIKLKPPQEQYSIYK